MAQTAAIQVMKARDALLALIKPVAAKYGCNVAVECSVATSAPAEAKWRVFIEKAGEPSDLKWPDFEKALSDSSYEIETAVEAAARLRREAAAMLEEASTLEKLTAISTRAANRRLRRSRAAFNASRPRSQSR